MATALRGKAARKAGFMREFQRSYQAVSALLPPLLAEDWTTAEFWYGCHKPATEAGEQLGRNRLGTLAAAARYHAKVWTEDGEVQVGPFSTPEPVQVTIRAAYARGSRHGTVTHWRGLTTGHPGAKPYGYEPELYLWERLD